MVNSSILWPQSDDDPFQRHNHAEQQSNGNELSSSWQNTSNTNQDHIPKWLLQTDEEQTDQQKAIRAMESKLSRVKRQNYSAVTPMNYDAIGSSYDQENDDDADDGPVVEDQEGLSLLWQQRYRTGNLDQALLHQKTDKQYISSTMPWMSWCMCCWRPSTD